MGSSGQLSGQFGKDNFLEVLEGFFPRVYLANNRDDGNKIIDLDTRRFPTGSRVPPNTPEGTDTRPPRTKRLKPADLLLDLRLQLHPDLFGHFINCLITEGYKLYEDQIPADMYNSRKYSFVIQPNAPKWKENLRYLFYVPKEILNKPLPENVALIRTIFFQFDEIKPGSFLIFFTNLEKVPHQDFWDLIYRNWPKGLRIHYVPLSFINPLASNRLIKEQKKNLLEKTLQIPHF